MKTNVVAKSEGETPPAVAETAPTTPQPSAEALDGLDTKETLAACLGATDRTVETWMAAGLIPYLKIGPRLIRFDREDVLRHLRRNCRYVGSVKVPLLETPAE